MRKINSLGKVTELKKEDILASVKDLTRVFSRHKVNLAYLFGSYGRLMKGGRTNPFSDLDIAIQYANHVPIDDYHNLSLALTSSLSAIFQREDIDLAIINLAPAVLRQRILKDGFLIFSETASLPRDFAVQTRREYFDQEPMRQVHLDAFLDRVKRGDIGGRFSQSDQAPKKIRGIRKHLKRISKN